MFCNKISFCFIDQFKDLSLLFTFFVDVYVLMDGKFLKFGTRNFSEIYALHVFLSLFGLSLDDRNYFLDMVRKDNAYIGSVVKDSMQKDYSPILGGNLLCGFL